MHEHIVITKEMGITHAEFLRLLPRALGSNAYHVTENRIEIMGPHQMRLEIELGPEETRQIALMRIPTTTVELTFTDYNDEARATFLDQFDRAYQRGGG